MFPHTTAAGLKELGEIELNKGKHKIKTTVAGKNKKSKNYYVLIDCVSVVLEEI